MMKRIFTTLILICSMLTISAQSNNTRVLFLGNSYTNSNNLPFLFKNISDALFDTVQYAAVTPGGYTMELHTTNVASLNNISLANWDYVVIQEQSQRPSFPNSQVQVEVFPYAKRLDSLINVANSCTETVFYMTWGRQNGDANNCPFFPPLCTYQGMDSLLNLRYRQMADSNAALVSPVGAVWNYIRSNHPSINLYSSDGSHPSALGTYAAACTFYTTIFRKDPTNINFYNTSNTTASNQIKAAVKAVVYDSLLKWNIGRFDNKASFSHQATQNFVQFKSQSPFMTSHLWNFGDGTTSTQENPNHVYALGGNYKVLHRVTNCGQVYLDSLNINVISLGLENQEKVEELEIYPNPTNGDITLNFNQDFKRVRIFSVKGRLSFDKRSVQKNANIDLSAFKSGVYFLECETKGGIVIRKKIVKLD